MGRGKEDDDENTFQRARRKGEEAIEKARGAIDEGYGAIQQEYDRMSGVKKVMLSIVIVLVAEIAVQKLLWLLSVSTEHIAGTLQRYTARIEGLSPTDQIAVLILGSLITATLLLSLQLRAIGYSLTKTNVYVEELRSAMEGGSSESVRAATDGGKPIDDDSDEETPRRDDGVDSTEGKSTSRIGAIGGALAGGTYGAIFGVAGIVAGIAIGAMFGEEMEKRISNQETKDRERVTATRRQNR